MKAVPDDFNADERMEYETGYGQCKRWCLIFESRVEVEDVIELLSELKRARE